MLDILLLDDVFQLTEVSSMPSHVRRNDQSDDTLAEQLELFATQLLDEIKLL